MESFTIESSFDATVEDVERLLDDPGLYPRLQAAMPGIREIELLERVEEGGKIRRRVRYAPHIEGKIPAFGRAFVKPEMLCWVEESTYDRGAHRYEYRIVPNLPAAWRERFDSHGSYVLTPAGPRKVHRRIECEIHVRVPLFGGRVERMLKREVQENFKAEAAAFARWLAGG